MSFLMRKYPVLFIISLSFYLFLLSPGLHAQLGLGQYEDEAPLLSWNILGVETASSLGMGGTGLAVSRDVSCALMNPALLSRLPRLSFTADYSYTYAAIFRYALVNTGVLSSEAPLGVIDHKPDFFGASFCLGGWAAALSYSRSSPFARPPVDLESRSSGTTTYAILFSQEGALENFNFSLSGKLFDRLSVGLGFSVHSGDWSQKLTENFFFPPITISDSQTLKIKGYSLHIGFALDIGQKLTAAGVFRIPHALKAEGESIMRYQSPLTGTDILIEGTAGSRYDLPLAAGMGLSYSFSPVLKTAVDLIFFHWKCYRVSYFGEPRPRDFRSLIKVGAGIEYNPLNKRSGNSLRFPVRLGVIYDPQPMKTPRSSYWYLTMGTGIHWKIFRLDVGGALGKEFGSGDGLSGKRYAVSLHINI